MVNNFKKVDVLELKTNQPAHWATKVCYECNETGHPGRFCPTRKCHQCNSFEHLSLDCPYPKQDKDTTKKKEVTDTPAESDAKTKTDNEQMN